MSHLLLIHIVVVLFFITNIDNIAVILSFLALPSSRRSVVILSYVACMMILLSALIVIFITTRKMIEISYLRYIGLIPIAMGILEIASAYYEKFKGQQKTMVSQNHATSAYDQFAINLTSQLAVSADSLALFLPIFLKCKDEGAFIFGVTMMVLVACVSIASLLLGRYLNLKWLDKFSSKLMPWLLIAVGVYVLYF